MSRDVRVQPKPMARIALETPVHPPRRRAGWWRGLYVEQYTDGSVLVDAGGISPRIRKRPPDGTRWERVAL